MLSPIHSSIKLPRSSFVDKHNLFQKLQLRYPPLVVSAGPVGNGFVSGDVHFCETTLQDGVSFVWCFIKWFDRGCRRILAIRYSGGHSVIDLQPGWFQATCECLVKSVEVGLVFTMRPITLHAFTPFWFCNIVTCQVPGQVSTALIAAILLLKGTLHWKKSVLSWSGTLKVVWIFVSASFSHSQGFCLEGE